MLIVNGKSPKYIQNKDVLANEIVVIWVKKREVPKVYTNKEVLENEVVESLIEVGSPNKCTQTRKSLKMKGEVPKVCKQQGSPWKWKGKPPKFIKIKEVLENEM